MTYTNTNRVATTEDWIGGTEGGRVVSYEPQCVVQQPNTIVTTQPAIELHPSNRSLREKARGQMSEFEREYSW